MKYEKAPKIGENEKQLLPNTTKNRKSTRLVIQTFKDTIKFF